MFYLQAIMPMLCLTVDPVAKVANAQAKLLKAWPLLNKAYLKPVLDQWVIEAVSVAVSCMFGYHAWVVVLTYVLQTGAPEARGQ
jgi:hypothetical protein